MENCAIIVAAGRGKRFGGYKQFHKYRGRQLLYYSLRAFEKTPPISTVVLVVPKGMIPFSQSFVKRYGFLKVRTIIPGGKRRQDSVRNGFQALGRSAACVVIHDGARPAVTPALLGKGLRLCRKYPAVIFGLPVTDTVKAVRGHRVLSTLDRDELFLIQTPQFFRVDLLARAYTRVNFQRNYTDEAGLIEAAGFPVYHFLGDRNNIKITDRDDLRLLKGRL